MSTSRHKHIFLTNRSPLFIRFEFKIDVSLLKCVSNISYVSFQCVSSDIIMAATMTNQQATTTGSLLSRLMAKTSAGAADALRFVFDDKDSFLLHEDGFEDDDVSTDSSTFGKWWNWRGVNNKHVENGGHDHEAELVHASPVRMKTRNVYARKPQAESLWSRRHYLTPTLQDVYVVDPHGKRCKEVLQVVSSTIWSIC